MVSLIPAFPTRQSPSEIFTGVRKDQDRDCDCMNAQCRQGQFIYATGAHPIVITSLDPNDCNSAILGFFSVNRLMHTKNIVEFCIVFGTAQLEDVIGMSIGLPPIAT